jgi:hypothetical protein
MPFEINKGPDWTPSQQTAGAIGFLASAAVAYLLVSQGYTTRNWAVVLVGVGLCVPPAIVGWLNTKR